MTKQVMGTRRFFRAALSLAVASGLLVIQPPATHADSFKVTICHVPPGNPANAHTIVVGVAAVPAHLALHGGDSLGECGSGS